MKVPLPLWSREVVSLVDLQRTLAFYKVKVINPLSIAIKRGDKKGMDPVVALMGRLALKMVKIPPHRQNQCIVLRMTQSPRGYRTSKISLQLWVMKIQVKR